MSDRQLALTITLGDIGAGAVVRAAPPEALAEPNNTGIISPCPAVGTTNVRLFERLADRRPGYSLLSNLTGFVQANSAATATFGAASRFLVIGINNATAPGGAVRYWSEGSGEFELVTATASEGRGLSHQPWTFAMVPNPALSPPNVLMFGNEASDIYTWAGGVGLAEALTDSLAPSGPKALISYLSRAFAFNVTSNGDKITTRLAWSAVGNGRDWSSLGSGSLDLDDDPYPGVGMLVIGGRLILFKGGKDGGAIYVGTPTGSSTTPLRIDAINPNNNIGPVVSRSIIPVTPTTAFFLGHDAVYLYDGVRALQPFAESVARDITSRLTPGSEDLGFAYYDRQTRVVRLFVAVDGEITPNEAWEFDIRTRRAYGPMTYAASMLNAQAWIPQGVLSWDTWGQAGARTWDTLTDTTGIEYFQWDNAIGTPSFERTVYTSKDGAIYTSAPTDTDDAGTVIVSVWTGPAITPKNWTLGRSGFDPTQMRKNVRILRDYDQLTLRSVTIRHRSTANWTPIVEISTDGTTWTKVSDDTEASATGGRLVSKTYTVNDQPPESWFQPRVRNTGGDSFTLRDVTLEFTYAGSARHTG